MTGPRTGAERYFKKRGEGTEYREAYDEARGQIDQIDTIIRLLDERRCIMNLTKAELARRSNLRPEVIRRLFSATGPNPTLSTVVALAGALDMRLAAEPLRASGVS